MHWLERRRSIKSVFLTGRKVQEDVGKCLVFLMAFSMEDDLFRIVFLAIPEYMTIEHS